jgi:predicted acylesterase/phospholipase RssA
LKIPFCAVATDFHTGERVVISEGELVEAVRASVSIPVIFYPVEIGKHTLVDGGLVDPVPVDVVKQMGATQIIAVSVSKSLRTAKAATEHRRKQSGRILPVTKEHGNKLSSSMLYQRMSGINGCQVFCVNQGPRHSIRRATHPQTKPSPYLIWSRHFGKQ